MAEVRRRKGENDASDDAGDKAGEGDKRNSAADSSDHVSNRINYECSFNSQVVPVCSEIKTKQ